MAQVRRVRLSPATVGGGAGVGGAGGRLRDDGARSRGRRSRGDSGGTRPARDEPQQGPGHEQAGRDQGRRTGWPEGDCGRGAGDGADGDPDVPADQEPGGGYRRAGPGVDAHQLVALGVEGAHPQAPYHHQGQEDGERGGQPGEPDPDGRDGAGEGHPAGVPPPLREQAHHRLSDGGGDVGEGGDRPGEAVAQAEAGLPEGEQGRDGGGVGVHDEVGEGEQGQQRDVRRRGGGRGWRLRDVTLRGALHRGVPLREAQLLSWQRVATYPRVARPAYSAPRSRSRMSRLRSPRASTVAVASLALAAPSCTRSATPACCGSAPAVA